VIPGSLSKPPPSATRPPHRASASIRTTTLTWKHKIATRWRRPASKPSPLAANVTTRALCVAGWLFVLGTAAWAHSCSLTVVAFFEERNAPGPRAADEENDSAGRRATLHSFYKPLLEFYRDESVVSRARASAW